MHASYSVHLHLANWSFTHKKQNDRNNIKYEIQLVLVCNTNIRLHIFHNMYNLI